ncbi:MAG: cobalamin-binding protein [Cellvibrionales bacterium]|nr:cobalamin-binding protein [Cellvibrionales bacterium]
MSTSRFGPQIGAWLGLLLALLCAPPSTAATNEHPEQRLISLAPHLTEILFAVGAGADIVGAVSYSDYPPAARQIPRVGSYHKLNHEAILALRPTLVLGWDSGNGTDRLDHLRSLGLPVFSHEPRTLEDVGASLARIGALVGREKQGQTQARRFAERLAALRTRYRGRKPLRLYYQLWHAPQMSVSDRHLIADLIRLCGGVNIFAAAPGLTPKVSIELIIRRDPQVIITTGMAAARPEWLARWQRWPNLSAVRHGQLYAIHPDLLHRHSPRILDGAEQLCRHLEQARGALAK